MSLFLSHKTTKNHSKALNTQCPKDGCTEQMWIPNLIRQCLTKQTGDLLKRGHHSSEGLEKISPTVFVMSIFRNGPEVRQALHGSSRIQNNKDEVGNLDIPVDLEKNENPRNCDCQCPRKNPLCYRNQKQICRMSIKVKSGPYNGLLSGLSWLTEESVCEIRVKDGVINFSSVGTRKTNIHIGLIQTLYAIAQTIYFSLPWSDIDDPV